MWYLCADSVNLQPIDINLSIDCYQKSIPIDNDMNLRLRLDIDYQYQSISWYRLVLIDIDCHRLSISLIRYPGISGVHASQETRQNVFIPANFFWDISVRFLSWECWGFWRRHDHFRRFPKKSEVFRRRPKSKLSRKRLSTKSEIARKVLLFVHLHMVFVPYMGLS